MGQEKGVRRGCPYRNKTRPDTTPSDLLLFSACHHHGKSIGCTACFISKISSSRSLPSSRLDLEMLLIYPPTRAFLIEEQSVVSLGKRWWIRNDGAVIDGIPLGKLWRHKNEIQPSNLISGGLQSRQGSTLRSKIHKEAQGKFTGTALDQLGCIGRMVPLG